MSKIAALVRFALNDTKNKYREVNFSIISNSQAAIIERETGVVVKGCIKYVTASGVRHAFNSHGNAELEALAKQIAVTPGDFEQLPLVLSAPDSYLTGKSNKRGNAAVLFKRKIGAKNYHVVMSVVKDRRKTKLLFNTMYIKKAGE